MFRFDCANKCRKVVGFEFKGEVLIGLKLRSTKYGGKHSEKIIDPKKNLPGCF